MNTEIIKDHKVFMSDRSKMELTGIEEVESFTDTSVVAVSSMGNISIEGEELKIENFSSENGKLIIHGNFDGFFYFGKESAKKKGFLSGFKK